MALKLKELPSDRINEAVDVLSDAFFNYPVMRFVIGQAGNTYAQRLRTLVHFFATARFVRNDLVMGVATDEDKIVAVANINRPGERGSSSKLDELRENVWRELGDAARSRYEAYGEATRKFVIEQPHYHLAMLGVHSSCTGQGLARRLLDALHERSYHDRESRGVTLNTEDPNNIPLYQHFGYRVIGEGRVSDELQFWAFYRDDAQVT
jgi:ribosomal protein S18 acetylase RimI-like enzyme